MNWTLKAYGGMFPVENFPKKIVSEIDAKGATNSHLENLHSSSESDMKLINTSKSKN